MRSIGDMQIVSFPHPQGCRGYLLADSSSKEVMAIDLHLDFVHDMAERVKSESWKVKYVVDTHTHADHPSGAFATNFKCARIAQEKVLQQGLKKFKW